MKRLVVVLANTCLLGLVGLEAFGQTTVRVAYCARTISSVAAPYAIAQKMGWYAKDGIRLELVPISGSTDCVKFLATKQVDYAGASVEPVAMIRAQGVKARIFYTYNQGFILGIAVPQDSPIKSFADLKVPVSDLITNDLIAEINDFDTAKIIAEAKAYTKR